MPRKPVQRKEKIAVLVNGTPVSVTLHPPSKTRKSWYAYWQGLTTSKSTGHATFDEAVQAVTNMLQNGGKRSTINEAVLSDDELVEIQRRHFAKKTDPAAQMRAQKSLRECLDAIRAFQEISGLAPVTLATPEDCERFQWEALERPSTWRRAYADNNRSKNRLKKRKAPEKLSPNTVRKWLVALQAAFERANRNGGKKCVRGVVPEAKLLDDNPWKKFTWISPTQKAVRHFDQDELISLLEFFASQWPGVSVAPAFAKVMLWSWARREEVSSLSWSGERRCGRECHFETTGKWGVKKWFRIPEALRADLGAIKDGGEFVFGAFPAQLRRFHLDNGSKQAAKKVQLAFAPKNLGDWMYRQVSKWSQSSPKGAAYLHVFRKTALQHALSGEHIESSVARDASISPSVLRASYAGARDEEFRSMSNRTYQRIRNSLSVEVATRYGSKESPADRIMEQLDLARSQGDWDTVSRLAEQLNGLQRQAG